MKISGRVNQRSLRKKIPRSKKFIRQTERNAKRKFDLELNRMIQDFNDHPITQELENPNGSNISGTLGSLNTNLFNFIGFFANDDPVQALRRALESSTTLSKKRTVKTVGRKVRVEYKVSMPSQILLKSVSKMPWSSKSWAFGVETGISGFNYFLNLKKRSSRSGKGIQSKFVVREGGFRPTEYITGILRRFVTRF